MQRRMSSESTTVLFCNYSEMFSILFPMKHFHLLTSEGLFPSTAIRITFNKIPQYQHAHNTKIFPLPIQNANFTVGFYLLRPALFLRGKKVDLDIQNVRGVSIYNHGLWNVLYLSDMCLNQLNLLDLWKTAIIFFSNQIIGNTGYLI